MKKKQPASRILEAVHETARGLHSSGLIDNRKMREYDRLCLPSDKRIQQQQESA